jgi:carbamoyl-phosphate synthase large subunit
MPRRNDIHRILIVGSGPIIIGQACEFDYSGAQACKALRADGYEVVLINSNPATIMTDPDLADRTYVEPLSLEFAEEVIRRERPDALLSTVGGQTGLNLSVALAEAGVLDKYGVELIGAKLDAIKKAEDRLLFKDAMRKIGLDLPQSQLVTSVENGLEFAARIGYPVILRPSFTMGGSGGGIAYHREDLVEILANGLQLSPVHEVLIEESVLGWKEFELEVMRDVADNAIIVCSIENFDPMGVHTGDSITVAPAQTLTDREYQMMRDAALACLREIGVDTGGSNVQFAIDPKTGRMIIIEMNPRVSRSSALASKATGFPIAKIAAKLAVGYRLDEIKNDITRKTPACFEPTIDYVVAKIPRWQFEKFPGAEPVLGTQMKSVGEVMAIGRTFKQALAKGMRSLETGRSSGSAVVYHDDLIEPRLITPNPDRLGYIRYAFERGYTEEQVHALTSVDPWFLRQVREAVDLETEASQVTLETATKENLYRYKRDGISDTRLARSWNVTPAEVRARRKELGVTAVFQSRGYLRG